MGLSPDISLSDYLAALWHDIIGQKRIFLDQKAIYYYHKPFAAYFCIEISGADFCRADHHIAFNTRL